jgi:hypothetical protein
MRQLLYDLAFITWFMVKHLTLLLSIINHAVILAVRADQENRSLILAVRADQENRYSRTRW